VGLTYGVGGIGVSIFFVLSGFLITRILLDYRNTQTFTEAARKFYWRRFLRLSPPFYAAIAVALVLGVGGSKFTLLMDATYLANFHVFALGHWTASSHFWSLAVEEQFYLVSFPIITLVSKRWLGCALLVILGASFAFDLVMPLAGYSLFHILLLGSAHGLLAGGLLALGLQTTGRLNYAIRVLDHWSILAVSLVPILLSLRHPYWHGPTYVVVLLAIDLLSLYVIKRCIESTSTWRWDWLEWGWLRHLGVISYGLYVYHYFIPQVIEKSSPKFFLEHRPFCSVLAIFVSFFVAELSWRFLERPILKFKDGVPRRQPADSMLNADT
jgi:peptidoglycan/LPS O-acetylase OafA/YrhL